MCLKVIIKAAIRGIHILQGSKEPRDDCRRVPSVTSILILMECRLLQKRAPKDYEQKILMVNKEMHMCCLSSASFVRKRNTRKIKHH